MTDAMATLGAPAAAATSQRPRQPRRRRRRPPTRAASTRWPRRRPRTSAYLQTLSASSGAVADQPGPGRQGQPERDPADSRPSQGPQAQCLRDRRRQRRLNHSATSTTATVPLYTGSAISRTWPAEQNIQSDGRAENRFGILAPLGRPVPLECWSRRRTADSPQNVFLVGVETIDGAKKPYYAFREGQIDGQVWIQQGDQRLKLVIVDRRDPADAGLCRAPDLDPQSAKYWRDFAFRPTRMQRMPCGDRGLTMLRVSIPGV